MWITETTWFHPISEWGEKMSVKCQSVSGSGMKDKVQKVILCLYTVSLFFRVMCKGKNMPTSKSEAKLLQPAHYWMTGSHCFWQRTGLIEMVPPSSLK